MTQRFGLSPAEEQLFGFGLAEQEAAFGGGESAYERLRREQRTAEIAAEAERMAKRAAEAKRAADAGAARQAPEAEAAQRAAALAESRRVAEARRAAAARAAEARTSTVPTSKARAADVPASRGVPLRELRSNARASAAADDARDAEIRAIASRIPGALESFEEERAVEERNAALRRAYSVVPGGPEALGAIERLVTGERKPSPRDRGRLDGRGGSRLPGTGASGGRLRDDPRFRTLPGERPSSGRFSDDPRFRRLPRLDDAVQREVDRALSATTPGEREALIRETVEKLPMGREAFESFRREQDLTARNDLVRRAVGLPRKGGPTSVSAPSSPALSPEAEAQLWDEMLAQEEGTARGGTSVYAQLREDARIWNVGLASDEAAARGGTSEYARLRAEERLVDEGLAIEEGKGFDRAAATEELIEIYKRGEFTAGDIARVEGVPPDVRQRAYWIALYEESPKRADSLKADALRAGGPLPEDSLGFSTGDGLGRLGGAVGGVSGAAWDAVVAGQAALSENDRAQQEVIRESAEAFGRALFDHSVVGVYEAEVRDDELRWDLYRAGVDWVGGEGAELWGRFESELGELDDLSSAEAMERWHQAILGGIVEGGGTYPLSINPVAMLEGLAGNRTYEGRDHPLFVGLPDGLRDALGGTLDRATRPEFAVPVAIGLIGGAVGAPFVAVAVLAGAVTLILEELADDGSPTVNQLLGEDRPGETIPKLLDLQEQLERRLDELDPDGTLREQYREP